MHVLYKILNGLWKDVLCANHGVHGLLLSSTGLMPGTLSYQTSRCRPFYQDSTLQRITEGERERLLYLERSIVASQSHHMFLCIRHKSDTVAYDGWSIETRATSSVLFSSKSLLEANCSFLLNGSPSQFNIVTDINGRFHQ